MKASKSTVGRPRQFDPDTALDQALQLFWQKGYEGTSLSDLTEAMGINRPSLYAAFGNKEELFRKALERYSEGPASYLTQSLAEPTARAVAERLLTGATRLLSDPANPRGCMTIQSALACGAEAEPVKKQLITLRCATLDSLRERFEKARTEGDLPPSADAAQLARYLATVIQGMSVQACGGATRDELQGVADMTLKAWPG